MTTTPIPEMCRAGLHEWRMVASTSRGNWFCCAYCGTTKKGSAR